MIINEADAQLSVTFVACLCGVSAAAVCRVCARVCVCVVNVCCGVYLLSVIVWLRF